MVDLEEAIRVKGEAVDLILEGYPDWALWLNNLGMANSILDWRRGDEGYPADAS